MDFFVSFCARRYVGVFLYIPLWFFLEVGGGGFLGTILWQSPVRKYCPAEASFTNCDVKTSSFYGNKLQLFLTKFTENRQIGCGAGSPLLKGFCLSNGEIPPPLT